MLLDMCTERHHIMNIHYYLLLNSNIFLACASERCSLLQISNNMTYRKITCIAVDTIAMSSQQPASERRDQRYQQFVVLNSYFIRWPGWVLVHGQRQVDKRHVLGHYWWIQSQRDQHDILGGLPYFWYTGTRTESIPKIYVRMTNSKILRNAFILLMQKISCWWENRLKDHVRHQNVMHCKLKGKTTDRKSVV